MPTQIDICNLALGKLGDEAVLSAVSPPFQSMQAQYCALFYPQALNVLLQKHAWGFATLTAALTQAATNNNPLWRYAYTLPSDYLNLITVKQPEALPLSYGGPAFYFNLDQFVEYDIQAGVLYCNIDNAVLVYVSSTLAVEANFTPLFVEALAWLLASMLAGPILKGDVGAAAAQRMTQMFGSALAAATEADGLLTVKRLKYVPAGIRGRW
ncbi:MAG: hypothetical protein PHW13_11970 [Methylococcales bacterium]|nr:hypothetical protein [Methylococcales bacterium]